MTRVRKMPFAERFLSSSVAGQVLGLSARTLDRYRISGVGPVYYKFGSEFPADRLRSLGRKAAARDHNQETAPRRDGRPAPQAARVQSMWC